jgi:hypothetical protein
VLSRHHREVVREDVPCSRADDRAVMRLIRDAPSAFAGATIVCPFFLYHSGP